MSDPQKVRELIADADRERRRAAACESIQRDIRLGSSAKIIRTKSLLGASWNGKTEALDALQTSAVYEALDIVRQRHLDRADEIEKGLPS